MKKVKYYLLAALFIGLLSGSVYAQSDLKVPLSNPGKAGKLIISTVFSDEIVIRTHNDDNNVVINYSGDDGDDEGRAYKDGLRRISTGGVGLEVTEEGNEVRIQTSPMPSDLELVVYVPKKFSLKLNATQGDVEVDGLEGEHEISAVNGDIDLTNLSGSAVVNSVNGDINVDFNRITPDVPMSFTGVNGDMKVTLPANAKFSVKMKTEWGDIYTNFDMEINRSSNAKEVSEDDGRYKVAVNKWLYGDVNGGGTEFLFKTLHGDISIRKKE
ncbi:MAG: DUF4097 domain-containing protein [Balneolaceae bacterium]|nr:DUF4097 domain-containing protein [Balneolaceae bacterium]